MPGPKPKYDSLAAKQRAYRDRNRDRMRQRREAAAEQDVTVRQLHRAVEAAATVGDELAVKVHQVEPAGTLAALRDHFCDVAGIPGSEDPREATVEG